MSYVVRKKGKEYDMNEAACDESFPQGVEKSVERCVLHVDKGENIL